MEKKVQKKVIQYAEKNDFICLKINVSSQRGWPDYLLIDPEGWHVWFEFKKPGSKPNPLQVYRATQLTERDVAVCVIDNYENGKDYIDAMVSARVSDRSNEASGGAGKRRIILGPRTGEN